MLKPFDNAKVKTKIQHGKMRGSRKSFSYDEGIKESQTSEHRESYDTVKGIRTDNASSKRKSIASQENKSVKNTRARQAVNPKKKKNKTNSNEKRI